MITTRKLGLATLIGVVGLAGGASARAAPPTNSGSGRQEFVALVSSPFSRLVKANATSISPSQYLATIQSLERQLLSDPSSSGDAAILRQIGEAEGLFLSYYSLPLRTIRQVQQFTVQELRQTERFESASIRAINREVSSGFLTAQQGSALISLAITSAEAQAAGVTRGVLNAATASR